jgi:hypothetical protein
VIGCAGVHLNEGYKSKGNTNEEEPCALVTRGTSLAAQSQHIGNSNRSSEEGHMCPACIASTAVMVAGAGSTGGILAVCIGKFRKVFRATPRSVSEKTKEK